MSESSAASDKPDAEQSEAEQPEVFANRAARRAKGKVTSSPEIARTGKRPIGRNGVQSPRQYGNRRSG